MSNCTITTAGNIVNETPSDGAVNPWECHTFTHTTTYTETVDFNQHTLWSLSGFVPSGLTIDPVTGVISGDVQPLNLQDTAIVNDITTKEKMLIDGSNYKNIGRPPSSSYDFTFTIKRDYTIWVDKVLNVTAAESTTSDVTITVIKNNNIDNLLYIVEYLRADTSVVNEEVTKHTIKIGDIVYDSTTIQECLDVHPGPFDNCGIII